VRYFNACNVDKLKSIIFLFKNKLQFYVDKDIALRFAMSVQRSAK